MYLELAGAAQVPQQDKPSPSPRGRHDEELAYAVELWSEDRARVEKVLARAFNISLARAIFRAALEENPGRRVVLSHGPRVVEDNGE
ncbi:MAG TPA: hypothetical protein VN718_08825 [Rhizomicrobium sp.]|nr:hypothetical protein [Rhizomicrobium sp.]